MWGGKAKIYAGESMSTPRTAPPPSFPKEKALYVGVREGERERTKTKAMRESGVCVCVPPSVSLL